MFDWLELAKKYHKLYAANAETAKNAGDEMTRLYDEMDAKNPAPLWKLKKTNSAEYLRAYNQYQTALQALTESDIMKELTARKKKAEKKRAFYFACREFCLRKYSKYSYAKLTEYIKENADKFDNIKSNYKKFEKIVKSVIGDCWSVWLENDYTAIYCNIDFLNREEKKALSSVLYYFEYIGAFRPLYTLHGIEEIGVHFPADDEPEQCVKAFYKYVEKREALHKKLAAAIAKIQTDEVKAGANCTPLAIDWGERWKQDLVKTL